MTEFQGRSGGGRGETGRPPQGRNGDAKILRSTKSGCCGFFALKMMRPMPKIRPSVSSRAISSSRASTGTMIYGRPGEQPASNEVAALPDDPRPGPKLRFDPLSVDLHHQRPNRHVIRPDVTHAEAYI